MVEHEIWEEIYCYYLFLFSIFLLKKKKKRKKTKKNHMEKQTLPKVASAQGKVRWWHAYS